MGMIRAMGGFQIVYYYIVNLVIERVDLSQSSLPSPALTL
jgi:hypothetical protein